MRQHTWTHRYLIATQNAHTHTHTHTHTLGVDGCLYDGNLMEGIYVGSCIDCLMLWWSDESINNAIADA